MPTFAKNISPVTIESSPDAAYFGEVTYPPGGTLGPRVQPFPQLVAIHEGDLRLVLDGKAYDIQCDQIALLPTGAQEFFQFAESAPTRHSWIDLAYDDDRAIVAELTPTPLVMPLSRAMSQLIVAGIAARMAGCASTSLTLRHLALAALNLYLQEAAEQLHTDDPMPDSVLLGRQYIETSYADPITLEDIADASHLSVNHVIRLFKKHLGQTPNRYLWQVRTRRGIDLLRNSGLSIAEIAYQVGFQTPFHFSRLVKQHAGHSPRELRKAAWGEADDDA